jgi:ATP-dependent DNA helicase PIF1
VSGKRITATPIEWGIEEEGKKLAEISQIPLRLAWAITVHKSQGMSLDAVEVDLSKSFEKGMGYVALSRVRSLDGLKLLGLNDVAMQVDKDILEFDKTLLAESDKVAFLINSLSKAEKEKMQKDFLTHVAPKKKIKEKKIPNHHKTKILLEEKKSLKEIAKVSGFVTDTIIHHIEELQEEGEKIDIEYMKEEIPKAKFKKIADAFAESFKKNGDYRLSPIKNALGVGFTYSDIRLARLFIEK